MRTSTRRASIHGVNDMIIKKYKNNMLVSLCYVAVLLFINVNNNLFAVDDILINDKQERIVCDYLALNMASIKSVQNLVADKKLLSSVMSIYKCDAYKTLCFGITHFGTLEHKATPNDLSIKSTALISGIAQKIKILTTGIFLEYGKDSYKSVHSFENTAFIDEKLSKDYIGVGVLCYLSLFERLCLDISAHKGELKSIFYNPSLTYFGLHAGGDYKLDCTKYLKLNVFSKYFFNHQDEQEKLTLYAKEILSIDDIDSQCLQCGLSASIKANEFFSFYGSVSSEYEFLGNVSTILENKDLNTQILRGSSQIVEFGILGKSNSCNIGLSIQKHVGVREGFLGIFRISFAFFDYIERFLGCSLEKFKNEKNGRFSRKFYLSRKECFFKVLGIVRELNGRITHKSLKKGYIVAFDFSKTFKGFCLDSTEVCIYIRDLSGKNVVVDVISNNNLLAEELSKKVFHILNKHK